MADLSHKSESPGEKLAEVPTRQSADQLGEVDNADNLQRHLNNRQIQLMYAYSRRLSGV